MSAATPIVAEARIRANISVGNELGLGGMTDAEIETLVEQALVDLSLDDPMEEITEHVQGDVNSIGQFDISTLAGRPWNRRTDAIADIESPKDQGPPTYLNPDQDYAIVKKAANSTVIQFYLRPAAAWRLICYRAWTTALAAADEVARRRAGLLTAIKAARTKAAKYADTNTPTLSADGIDYKTKASGWIELAETLEEEYANSIARPDRTRAAVNRVTSVEMDLRPFGPLGGRHLVHHHRRR